MDDISLLYDDFVAYVEEVDSIENPRLSIDPSYDVTQTSLVIKLRNVECGSSEFYNDIERFRRGTKMTSRPSSAVSGDVYKVQIPLNVKKTRQVKSKRSRPIHSEKPEVTELMIYLMLAMAVLTGTALTTTWNEWQTFLR